MIPRTTYCPSDLIETQAASLGRTVTSKGASAGVPVAEGFAARGWAGTVSAGGGVDLGAGDAACTVPLAREGWEDWEAAGLADWLPAAGAPAPGGAEELPAGNAPRFWRST